VGDVYREHERRDDMRDFYIHAMKWDAEGYETMLMKDTYDNMLAYWWDIRKCLFMVWIYMALWTIAETLMGEKEG
jgi:hypothetical protein